MYPQAGIFIHIFLTSLWNYAQDIPSMGGKNGRLGQEVTLNYSPQPKDLIPLDVDRLRLKLLKKKSPGTVKNVYI